MKSNNIYKGKRIHPDNIVAGIDKLLIGLDVGSTTVKAVVVNPENSVILWQDYRRHETCQSQVCLDFLVRIETAFPEFPPSAFQIFITGTGSDAVKKHIGAHFVQEVNAVAFAVEKLYPDVRCIIELGGQDAKIVILKKDKKTGKVHKIPTMNDKCAGGTGAIIDKISAKLEIPPDKLSSMNYDGFRLHTIAGKCGVFAETDINSLQKQGVPAEELMASLFESIVQQNLTVLTRGHTIKPNVLLLGGPNRFIKGMQECWRHNIRLLWEERDVQASAGKPIEELVCLPENAEYFGALGAVEFGKHELEDNPELGKYLGKDSLHRYVERSRRHASDSEGLMGLVDCEAELEHFVRLNTKQPWIPATYEQGAVVGCFIGLDGGSTSTKAVLIDEHRNVIAKAYQLSKGNPIEDTIEVLGCLRKQIEDQGCRIKILGVATTGYAKDTLKEVIGADIALVETVAHTQSGVHYYPHADVICDVGGQDIKVIILKNGAVKDFKLNTQCSAGNGYYLQSTASAFGYRVDEYAEIAFRAKRMPEFGYGCAVFMQSDIVDFQRQGWKPSEIMAGLAAVLPKNIWLYVCKIPNIARLGKTFVLQGGTQHNLAAVKAQVDYIESRFKGTGITPDIIVHEHCGESGAIGCAFEAQRLFTEEGNETSFIGFDALESLNFTSTHDESTRCSFCRNKCLRTFIDIETQKYNHRLIIAPCEKGSCENITGVREVNANLTHLRKSNPDLIAVAAHRVYDKPDVTSVADAPGNLCLYTLPWNRKSIRMRNGLLHRRENIRIGIPRVMNMYSLAPFFLGYFQSLGIRYENIVWSDYTSDRLYKEGGKRGSVDPCFPSKVAIAHMHNLIHNKHSDHPLDYIYFPMVDSLTTDLNNLNDSRTCPTSVGTVEGVYAAFTKEKDIFTNNGITFKKTFINLGDTRLCAHQMYHDWCMEIGVSKQESYRAVKEGLEALKEFNSAMRKRGRTILEMIEKENRLGIVILARPYHNDPGINHGVTEALQKLGCPVFSMDSLPLDHDILQRIYGPELEVDKDVDPLSISDVWKSSYSENGSRKLWAAKYVARHPNLVAVELSNFKCGHDAPIFSTIEEIVESSGTPFFYLRDIDENKPTGTIKIRIETLAYFLERYHRQLDENQDARTAIEEEVSVYELQLRAGIHDCQEVANSLNRK